MLEDPTLSESGNDGGDLPEEDLEEIEEEEIGQELPVDRIKQILGPTKRVQAKSEEHELWTELNRLREDACKQICNKILGHRSRTPTQAEKKKYSVHPIVYLSNSDSYSPASRDIAELIGDLLGYQLVSTPPVGQKAGTLFESVVREFLTNALGLLAHLRPGSWTFGAKAEQGEAATQISQFDQYQHLLDLQNIIDQNPEVEAALGRDYIIKPDIVVGRRPVNDEEINSAGVILHPDTMDAIYTPLRASNDKSATVLHASISCKWTIRSDRSQNSRTEALNLIRNRKGRAPHIIVVTFEPVPTRIASIALGTGDIDCVYHAALPELKQAVYEVDGYGEQSRALALLIDGRRLRDLTDLPFDLAI